MTQLPHIAMTISVRINSKGGKYMKRVYTEPEMMVQVFSVEDVIATSGGSISGGEGGSDVGGGGGILD